MSEPQSQKQYNKIYKKEHRDKQRKYNYKSMCKHFILDFSDKNDIRQIRKWIELRLREL